MKKPLVGIRVIDLTTSYAGPTASMYLADMGADVVKVERPDGGDDTRGWGPPFIGDTSAWFGSANRGKRSICLDIRTALGRAVLDRLLESADVLLANLSPGKLEKLGLDPDSITQAHPRIIYCALSGFGLSGPDSANLGYDLIAQARSGLMSVTGELGRDPQRSSTALTDIAAGMTAAFAIAASLRDQAITGRGSVIDVSLLDVALNLMAPRLAAYLAGGPEPEPSGATDSVLSIYQSFRASDRSIVLAIGNDAMWHRFCTVLDRADLADNPEFATNADRVAHRSELIPTIADTVRTQPAAAWLERLNGAGIPCALVHTLSEVVADGHVVARGVINEVAGDDGSVFPMTAPPWRHVQDQVDPRDDGLGVPRLGEHTVEILTEAGYSDEEIEDLILARVITAAP